MTEPVYRVTLYAGDLKFTNDYSNVLQFSTKESRDEYFDHLDDTNDVDVLTIDNTMENKIFLDGGSIKIAVNSIDKDNLHRIVYCCIETYLNGGELNNQSRKYYFVNSYEIISSYQNVTVIAFNIEYDYWMNNQFDFDIRESNVERSHMDRWNSDGKIIYTKPQSDGIDSNMQVEFRQILAPQNLNVVVHEHKAHRNVIWALVTCSHTMGEDPDSLFYHIIPLIYEANNLWIGHASPLDGEEYYTNNAIKCGVVNWNGTRNMYYPSLECLTNLRLLYACGLPTQGTSNDKQKILNIQIFTYLPFKFLTKTITVLGVEIEADVVCWNDNTPLPLMVVPDLFGGDSPMYISSFIADLTEITKYLNEAAYVKEITDLVIPQKPVASDNTTYSDRYEPALFLSPVRQKFLAANDNTAIAEIPNYLSLYVYNNGGRFIFKEHISYSPISGYTYYTVLDLDRQYLNSIGFAFNKCGYLYSFLNDEYGNYCMTQRDIDRSMMWTNILTGGLAEGGSTAVSAGIGWRSNMERSYLMGYSSNFAKSQTKYNRGYVKGANGKSHQRNPAQARFYDDLNKFQFEPAESMYAGMAGNAMAMSGVGGITAFSANAIHQGMAQMNKEKVMRNTPSSMGGAGNAESAIINNQIGTSFVVLKCDDSSYEQYKNLFMKYGYFIGGVIIPNINSRKFFNYIKTNGAILTGKCNNLILSSLANILDTGVTIWHMDYCAIWDRTGEEPVLTGNTIYDYTKENIERSLM